MPSVDIHITYLKIAKIYSEMSYAVRKKVGAILVREGRIVSTGYNGMPAGMSNVCEIDWDKEDIQAPQGFIEAAGLKGLETKDEVIHAEMNAILFAAKNGQSTQDCSLYVTLSPCVDCVKAIIQSGITKVYFLEEYRNKEGLGLMTTAGINYYHYKLS